MPIVTAVLATVTTGINRVQTHLSGLIPDNDFGTLYRPPMVYTAAQLQSTLFHAVHDHTLERYSVHNATQAELHNKAMGAGEYERYSEYYGEMNFLYSYAAFIGQVEILLGAAETNDINRQRQGVVYRLVEAGWETVDSMYTWYQRATFGGLKVAVDTPEVMQWKQNIGAFKKLLKAVRNVTKAIGRSIFF